MSDLWFVKQEWPRRVVVFGTNRACTYRRSRTIVADVYGASLIISLLLSSIKIRLAHQLNYPLKHLRGTPALSSALDALSCKHMFSRLADLVYLKQPLLIQNEVAINHQCFASYLRWFSTGTCHNYFCSLNATMNGTLVCHQYAGYFPNNRKRKIWPCEAWKRSEFRCMSCFSPALDCAALSINNGPSARPVLFATADSHSAGPNTLE